VNRLIYKDQEYFYESVDLGNKYNIYIKKSGLFSRIFKYKKINTTYHYNLRCKIETLKEAIEQYLDSPNAQKEMKTTVLESSPEIHELYEN